MLSPLVLVLMLAAATASISYTLTKTQIFDWVRDSLPPHDESMLGFLWQCPYCMAHWIGFALVILIRPLVFTGGWIDIIPATFAVVMIAAFFIQAFMLLARILTILKYVEDTQRASSE